MRRWAADARKSTQRHGCCPQSLGAEVMARLRGILFLTRVGLPCRPEPACTITAPPVAGMSFSARTNHDVSESISPRRSSRWD